MDKRMLFENLRIGNVVTWSYTNKIGFTYKRMGAIVSFDQNTICASVPLEIAGEWTGEIRFVAIKDVISLDPPSEIAGNNFVMKEPA